MIKTNKTKFIKENFRKDGMYLLYAIGSDWKFVARFKYNRVPFTMAQFRKELIANHSPSEYFKAHDNGKAPLEILRDANPAWYSKIIAPFVFSV